MCIRDRYKEAEEKTIRELQNIGKPFVVLVNSKKPFNDEARGVAAELEANFGVKAMPVNCEQLKEEDIYQIMEAVLYEFPVSEVQFFIPKWVEMLPRDHRIKQDMLVHIKEVMDRFGEIKDAAAGIQTPDSPYTVSYTHLDVYKRQSLYRKDLVVADTVYSPEKTKMILEAEEAGCKAIGGKGMLQQQGAVNYELFVGKKMPLEEYNKFQAEQAK